MSSSHLISHSPRETDTSCDASTRTGYGVWFSVTVPPRAAGVALRGRGAGWGVRPTVGPQDRHPPGGGTGGPDGTGAPRRGAHIGTGGPGCEPGVPRPEE